MPDNAVINPFPTITLSEVIDIIFVAILLYTAIVWAQRTRAVFVVRGIVILGAIYIIARYLDLQMTAWVFQGFFAVFLIMIVVIFQEELRQFFERIAIWSLTRKRVRPLGSNTADTLVRTLSDLAKERVGALVVIRGSDPLERHITGGIPIEPAKQSLTAVFPRELDRQGHLSLFSDRLLVHLRAGFKNGTSQLSDPCERGESSSRSTGRRNRATRGQCDL